MAAKQTGDKLSGVIGRENVEKVRYELKVLQGFPKNDTRLTKVKT